MSQVFILQSQQAAWRLRSLIQSEPSAGKSVLILDNSSGSSVSITGLDIPGQGLNDTYSIINRGTDPIDFLANNAESVVAHQFADSGTINADASIRIFYNGLRWEILSDSASPGGDAGIGNVIAGATEGSVLYAGPTGLLAQSNADFFYNSVLKRLILWNKNFLNFQAADSVFAIGDLDPLFNGNTWRTLPNRTYFIDIEPAVITDDYAIGIFSRLLGKSILGGLLTGISGNVSSYQNKTGIYLGNLVMKGVEGQAYVRSLDETIAVGGYFIAHTGGNSGLVNNTPLYGVHAEVAGGHNGTTPFQVAGKFVSTNTGGDGLGIIGEARCVWAVVDGAPSLTDYGIAKGLALEGWTPASGGNWAESYGIYADASIDQGDIKYFIYSESTSPSLFSGPVEVPPETYGPTWEDNPTAAVKLDLYNKIETLVADAGGPNAISSLWSGSQAQYDVLTPDAETLYFIV